MNPNSLIIEGIVMPLDKKNANGWGIRSEDAQNVIDSLKGMPVRVCSREDEHSCDRIEDPFSEIGRVIDVWAENGYIKAKALITDRIAIQKIEDGTWEPYWSIYGLAKVDEDGWAKEFEARSISLVRNPAWKEAQFHVAASESGLCITYFDEFKILGGVKMGVVPKHPWNYGKDAERVWSRPDLKDFTDKSFEELTDAEKRSIAGHFAWAASMPPEKYADLKLPHHFPDNHAVSLRGVRAAVAAIRGARGGVNIPTADKEKALKHLVAHITEDFGLEPPSFVQSSMEKEGWCDEVIEKVCAGLEEKIEEVLRVEASTKNKSEPVEPVQASVEEVEKLRKKVEELKEIVASKEAEIKRLRAELEEKEKVIAARLPPEKVEELIKTRVEAAIKEYEASIEKKKAIEEYKEVCASLDIEVTEEELKRFEKFEASEIREITEKLKLVAGKKVAYPAEPTKVGGGELTVGRWDAEKGEWVV